MKMRNLLSVSKQPPKTRIVQCKGKMFSVTNADCV